MPRKRPWLRIPRLRAPLPRTWTPRSVRSDQAVAHPWAHPFHAAGGDNRRQSTGVGKQREAVRAELVPFAPRQQNWTPGHPWDAWPRVGCRVTRGMPGSRAGARRRAPSLRLGDARRRPPHGFRCSAPDRGRAESTRRRVRPGPRAHCLRERRRAGTSEGAAAGRSGC